MRVGKIKIGDWGLGPIPNPHVIVIKFKKINK